jgi:hypothetical protein
MSEINLGTKFGLNTVMKQTQMITTKPKLSEYFKFIEVDKVTLKYDDFYKTEPGRRVRILENLMPSVFIFIYLGYSDRKLMIMIT